MEDFPFRGRGFSETDAGDFATAAGIEVVGLNGRLSTIFFTGDSSVHTAAGT
jgi:hypothetical protein